MHNLQNSHPLYLVPRTYTNTTVTELISTSHSYPQSPVTHIVAHQPNIEDTYEQIKEQPHTTNFRSQINHLFSPQLAARLDPSTVPFLTHPISNFTLLLYQYLMSLPLPYHQTPIIHHAWILMITPQAQFFMPSHNLTIPILKLQMNSRIPSPDRPLYRNPPSVHSKLQLRVNLPRPFFLHRRNFNPLPNDQRPTRPPSI